MALDASRTLSDNPTLGIYISVPFCRAKCSFCNFASGVSSPGTINSYIATLCKEISGAFATARRVGGTLPQTVDTLYFGGGTPSLLEPAQLRRIFAVLRENYEITADAEITMEAAPGQISDTLLYEAQCLGVNRISLGIQSFVDGECAAVGRLHTERECIRDVVRLQSAGVSEICADLIAGLPYQTTASWQHSLDVATSIGLTHLSVYMLEIDEDSRLGRELISGGSRFHAHGVPADEASADFYEMACARLPEKGFLQYEISNFAATQHRARHNLKYWLRDPYLGFGLDAHSMLLCPDGAVRFSNPDVLARYQSEIIPSEPIRVRGHSAFEEAIFLGLRLNEGVSLSQLRRDFPGEFVSTTERAARELIRNGLITEQNDRWQLTGHGRLVSNDVFTNLLMGVAA